ncbi:hypothetical protein [Pendulispora albinea]|uniref:Uncharacterized protein n=1 Tax=Pendulispora albinea TaxID=2741071 RepID=A0ABZ2LZ41_9BACT
MTLAPFDVGVELAQLAIVGSLRAVAHLARARVSDARKALATRSMSYVLGALVRIGWSTELTWS